MNKFFSNMKIRQKLISAFSIVLVLTAFLGGLSIYRFIETESKMEYILTNKIEPIGYAVDVRDAFLNIRFSVLKACAYAGTDATAAEMLALVNGYNENVVEFEDAINEMIRYIEEDDTVLIDSAQVHELNDKFHNEYAPEAEACVAAAKSGDYAKAMRLLESLANTAQEIQAPIDSFVNNQIVTSRETLGELAEDVDNTIIFIIVIAVIIALLSLTIAILVSSDIQKKLNQIVGAVNRVSKGDFSEPIIFNTSDEIGQLSRDLGNCIDTIHEMVQDTKELGIKQQAGYMNSLIDESKYEGEYKEMMTSVNVAFSSFVEEVVDFIYVVESFSNGDFSRDLKEQLPGDKALVNKVVNVLRENLTSIEEEISKVVKSASEGNLEVHADSSNYSGEWKSILEGLNDLIYAIVVPFNETREVITDMSKGNLSSRMNGEYKGDFEIMKNAINGSMSTFANYINIIDETLGSINNNDLTVSINEEFVGDFDNLKNAINNIIIKLNEVFNEFLVGADEVAIGAQQISNSSISLADGAAEQVTSLNSLTRGVQKVSESSAKNAENANKANKISEISKGNAITGDGQMKQMLVSMGEISESSNEISKIIKVIEDIAFQTNLLALNAAVEAARAGTHGKGFAVVADEVRTLAARSSQAAKETTELIQTSISRVAFGSELAKSTASALDEIVTNVSDVANIIEEISESSKEQAELVQLINSEIGIVENVVLKTSAASEEGVSTAEELSSQSTVLRDLIGTFRLGQ